MWFQQRREINCWNNGAEGRFFITAHNLIKLGWFMQRKSIVQTGTNAEKAFDPCYAEGHVRWLILDISQWKVGHVTLCCPFTLHPSAPGLWAVAAKWSISSTAFLHLEMGNPGPAGVGERDRQEDFSARTELGNSGINTMFSLGCITNCWAREECRCGLVGSRIN